MEFQKALVIKSGIWRLILKEFIFVWERSRRRYIGGPNYIYILGIVSFLFDPFAFLFDRIWSSSVILLYELFGALILVMGNFNSIPHKVNIRYKSLDTFNDS